MHFAVGLILALLFESGSTISFCVGLTSKAERAAVGEATKLWSSKMADAAQVDIDLSSQVYKCTALKAQVFFGKDSYRVDEGLKISCLIANEGPKQGQQENAEEKSHHFPIQRLQLFLTDDSNESIETLTFEFENLSLGPGDKHLQDFEFQPRAGDVGKMVRVSKVALLVGNKLQMNIVQNVPKSDADDERMPGSAIKEFPFNFTNVQSGNYY